MKYTKLLLALAMTSASYAGVISINLAQPSQFGASGSILTYSGTLLNTGGVTENLNDAQVTLSTLTSNTGPFFANAAFFLTAGQSDGPYAMFTVTIGPGAPLGTYNGTFTILGGPGANDQTVIGSTTFSTVVTPEPTSIGMMFAGIAGLALARRRLATK